MQKRLGLIGGVSPESTVIYYRLLNQFARDRLGGQHSADILLAALDYGQMVDDYQRDDWSSFKEKIVDAAIRLRHGGVDAIVITSNTTQMAADAAREKCGLPVIHLLDALADELRRTDIKQPLLLGTPFTMDGPYYRTQLSARYDGDVVTPTTAEQSTASRIIFDELVDGVVLSESRQELCDIIERSTRDGADGVILGCTELCMILDQTHVSVPVLDTTSLHARAAHDFAFQDHESGGR